MEGVNWAVRGTFRLIYEMKSQLSNHLSCFPSVAKKNRKGRKKNGLKLRKNDKGTSWNDAAKWNWQWEPRCLEHVVNAKWTEWQWHPNVVTYTPTSTWLSTLFGPALSSYYYSNWSRFSVYFSHFSTETEIAAPWLIHTDANGLGGFPIVGSSDDWPLTLLHPGHLSCQLLLWQIVVAVVSSFPTRN